MSKQSLYMAMLTIYENNFRVLHWKIAGQGFHYAHKRFGEYYETLGDYLDETAEAAITCGEEICNSKNALDMLSAANDIEAIVIDTSPNFSVHEANKLAHKMMLQLYDIAKELEEDSSLPPDVRDVYMKHLGYYRIEGKYQLDRAMKFFDA